MDLCDAWNELSSELRSGWYISRPEYDMGSRQWRMFAFAAHSPEEAAETCDASAETEAGVIVALARALHRKLREPLLA
jgi:hypothetical protein